VIIEWICADARHVESRELFEATLEVLHQEQQMLPEDISSNISILTQPEHMGRVVA
jgi:hypothetical protein